MNSLSWLIYLISMLDTLRGFMIAGFVFSCIMFIGSAIFRSVGADEGFSEEIINSAIRLRNWCLGIAVALAVSISIVPDKNTMVLIAASEIGERVINSDTAQEIAGEVRSVVTPSTELLRTWIEDQTRQIRAAAPRTN